MTFTINETVNSLTVDEATQAVTITPATNALTVDQTAPLPGPGVPAAGTTGQVLTKLSNTSFDTGWAAAGGISSLIFDDSVSAGQVLYGDSIKTGLGRGNSTAPLKLEAATSATINDDTHDYNVGLFVRNWTADGAGLVVGNSAAGDGIYAQASDTSLAQTIHPFAINVDAGTTALQTTVSGTATATTTTTLTDTSKTWTTNQWANRYVCTPDNTTPASTVRGFILSNTADTLTIQGWTQSTGASGVSQQAAATPSGTTGYVIDNTYADGIHVKRYSKGRGLYVQGATSSGNNGTNDELVLFDLNSDAPSTAKITVWSKGGTVFGYFNQNGEFRSHFLSLVGNTGAQAGGRWMGTTTTGSPTTGTYAVGDFVTTRDTIPKILFCTSAGTPGLWTDPLSAVTTTSIGAVPTSRTLTAGTGLLGSGDLSADRTFSIDTTVVVDKTTAQTLTNKTLTAPAITSPTGIVKADVGLGNVDNTADTAKPVSTAQQTALNLKANLAGPTFTGTVTIPTGASISTPATFTVKDTVFTVQDDADTSKQLQFQLSSISPSTIRTVTIPDASGTLVYTSRNLTAGTGLTGGGDLSADRTFTVAYGSTSTTACVGNDARLSDTRTPTDGTVTTAKIVDANVTLAKIANIAASTFLGNNTVGAAAPIALTVAQTKTLLALVKGDVGLGNVDNTADASKTFTESQITNLTSDLALLAPLASPTLTGNPNATGGSWVLTDGTAAHGEAKMAVSALGPGFNLFDNSGDTTAMAVFLKNSIKWGPANSAADVTFTRTGVGTMTVVGTLTIPAPVISGHATIEGVTPTGATGTGKLVFDTAPTFATTLAVTGNIGFNGKTPQALTGIAAPTATALRTAAPNATYSTTGATGTTAGAFDTNTHRDNVITDLANTMQRLAALITDLRANGVIG